MDDDDDDDDDHHHHHHHHHHYHHHAHHLVFPLCALAAIHISGRVGKHCRITAGQSVGQFTLPLRGSKGHPNNCSLIMRVHEGLVVTNWLAQNPSVWTPIRHHRQICDTMLGEPFMQIPLLNWERTCNVTLAVQAAASAAQREMDLTAPIRVLTTDFPFLLT